MSNLEFCRRWSRGAQEATCFVSNLNTPFKVPFLGENCVSIQKVAPLRAVFLRKVITASCICTSHCNPLFLFTFEQESEFASTLTDYSSVSLSRELL